MEEDKPNLEETLVIKGDKAKSKTGEYGGTTLLKDAVADLVRSTNKDVLMGRKLGTVLTKKGERFNVILFYQDQSGEYIQIGSPLKYEVTKPDPKEPTKYRLLQGDPFYDNKELHTFATDLPLDDPRRNNFLVQIIDEFNEEVTQKMQKSPEEPEEQKWEVQEVYTSTEDFLSDRTTQQTSDTRDVNAMKKAVTDTAVLKGGIKDRLREEDTRRRFKKIDEDFKF